jgi:glycosyltransferase involved in cell wall biosynthesis
MSEPRVLVISHGHPDFSLGGGEISARSNWLELRRRGIEALFLARLAASTGHTGAVIAARSADGFEALFDIPPVNHFRHSQPQTRIVTDDFRGLLERFRPTAVHFHHYVHLGLEFVREVRNYSPDVSIVMTLHEFLAICHAQGQMLKTNGLLCSKATPLDCHLCYPDIPPQDFFMRELFIKSFLGLVDHFICPSAFLRDRYIAWGLPAEKMVVLENGQTGVRAGETPESLDRANETRFVLLGQLSRLKGTLVLLEALRLLPEKTKKLVRFEIYGSMQYADEAFKAELKKGLRGLEEMVRFCGPYRPEDVTDIIQSNGWVVVPSIWWENSPLVIQEAFAAGRPVICSNIGGMAEKVVNGVSGFHFRVNNPGDLATRIEQCATAPEIWRRICTAVPRPPTIEKTVNQLLRFYAAKSSIASETAVAIS